MTTRTTVSEANEPSVVAAPNSSTSDYESVDDTAGPVFSIISLFVKAWWLWVLIIGAAALSFPYLFPSWAENYKKELQEMGTAANTTLFIKNAKDVNWNKAFSSMNLEYLKLVGTGRHPQFKETPGLAEGTWYTSNGFIMKSYVTEKDFIKYATGENLEGFGDNLSPATEIEQGDAAEYCQSQGGRLPTWKELSLASWFAFTKKWQGKTGDFLKPNLKFEITSKYSLWTSSPEGDGFYTRDNFRIFTRGKKDNRFEDDGVESATISFLCIKDEKNQ